MPEISEVNSDAPVIFDPNYHRIIDALGRVTANTSHSFPSSPPVSNEVFDPRPKRPFDWQIDAPDLL